MSCRRFNFLSLSPAVPLRRFAVLAIAFACLSPLAVVAGKPGALVSDRISDNPRAHHEPPGAVPDCVVPRMNDAGVREGRIVMARDAGQTVEYPRHGRIDRITGRPIRLAERDGLSHHPAVFVARSDSGTPSRDEPGRRMTLLLAAAADPRSCDALPGWLGTLRFLPADPDPCHALDALAEDAGRLRSRIE